MGGTIDVFPCVIVMIVVRVNSIELIPMSVFYHNAGMGLGTFVIYIEMLIAITASNDPKAGPNFEVTKHSVMLSNIVTSQHYCVAVQQQLFEDLNRMPGVGPSPKSVYTKC